MRAYGDCEGEFEAVWLVGRGGVGLLRHTNLVFYRRISSLLQYQVTWKSSKYEAYTTEACLRMLTGEGTAKKKKIIKGIWLKCHLCKSGILYL